MEIRDTIKNGRLCVCHECHILFYISIYKHIDLFRCASYPYGTYEVDTDKPKAVCPKCKKESGYNIRLETDL